MSQRVIFSVLSCVLLAACAQHTVWTHAQPFTNQQLAADWSQCVNLASQTSSNSGLSSDFGGQMTGTAIMINQRDLCMNGKGWTQVGTQ